MPNPAGLHRVTRQTGPQPRHLQTNNALYNYTLMLLDFIQQILILDKFEINAT